MQCETVRARFGVNNCSDTRRTCSEKEKTWPPKKSASIKRPIEKVWL